MSKNNIDQALAALADALKGIELNSSVNYKTLANSIPHRSLTGDHINGGKILKFASAGITDQANKEQILIKDDGVSIKNFTEGFAVNGAIQVNEVQAKSIKTETIHADQIIGKIEYANDTPIVFSGDNIEGKGILWAGRGNTKQLIFASNPDRFFVSENIDFAKGKSITANGIKLIDEKELGTTVTKSNLKELGRLNGLIVDGDVSVGQYLYFSNATNRLGLGIEEPNSAFSIAEDGIEIITGTKDFNRGYIGTYASHAFELVTDNTARITISAGGNIILGNQKLAPVQVSVHGKLSVKVNTPDPEVDLHIAGPVKFNNRLQTTGRTYPTAGSFNSGDIVWNSDPKINQYVGWVCVQAGSPGLWEPFGKIGNS